LAALRQRPTEGVYRLSTLPGSDDQSPVALLPRSRQHGGLSGRLGLGVNGAVEGDHAKLLRVDRLTVSANLGLLQWAIESWPGRRGKWSPTPLGAALTTTGDQPGRLPQLQRQTQ